ncbi:MAG: glycosyltransferase [Limnoraphis robusta]|jgi:zeaxanthin glucosyltransferase
MTHFGIICPASTGHLNTMLPLGQELQRRGHCVTVINVLDSQAKVLSAGLEFQTIGESKFPLGSTAASLKKLGELNGLAALRYTINLFKERAVLILQEAPKAIQEIGIECLLVDQTNAEGGTVAEFLNIPFVTICSAVVLNRDPNIPPFNTVWPYSPSVGARLRNHIGYLILNRVGKPIREVVSEYRRAWNLPPHTYPNNNYSKLAQISQQPAELEFPRKNLPAWFHFTGPYHYSSRREPVAFPWEKLTDKPLIYASMGTVQNRLVEVFQTIASACEGLDAQLVISLGGSASPESLPKLPGNPLVVEYAPQLELLQKTSLTITHAGMNTTLECLNNGVPMVAIPVANDQPGVAARIAWAGAGEAVPLKKLNVSKLRVAVEKVLTESSYKQNALRLQEAIKRAGGVQRAADIIEQAVSTGKPVLALTKQ